MARYTYEEAVKAAAMLDGLDMSAAAKKAAMEDIRKKLGDSKFPESVGGLGFGDLQRASDLDAAIEKRAEEASRKNKLRAEAMVEKEALRGLVDSVINPEQAAVDRNLMYGTGPITESEYKAFVKKYAGDRNLMYGTGPITESEYKAFIKKYGK